MKETDVPARAQEWVQIISFELGQELPRMFVQMIIDSESCTKKRNKSEHPETHRTVLPIHRT